MNKLIRSYNKNRYMIWLAILLVIAVIVIIQILNKLATEKNNITGILNKTDNHHNNYNFSVITEQEIKPELAQIIDEFIAFCNNGQKKEAYQLLSDECKKELYPTLEDFTNKYHDKIFIGKKSYICQAWITSENIFTYRIDFTEDMLATGKPSKTSILDYYTIVNNNNNEYKLNINKFIGTDTLNIKKTIQDITINIQKKKKYMDYEIYDIEIINNTKNTIMLDDMQSMDNIYLEDYDEKKYFWYNHENTENDFIIRSGETKKNTIKFNKEYKPYNETKNIIFEKIMLNKKEIININIAI